jgi:hypothetical protein
MRSNGQAFNPGKQEKKSELTRRKGMTLEERSRLEALDKALRAGSARDHIRSVVLRVREELARKKDAVMSWDAVPLHIFATTLPPEIRSAWVFVLRAGADTGAERHPNSHQRMMSFEGSGDLQTGEPGRWQSNVLVSDPDAPLERRWISIPTNVWHRPVIDAAADWAVVSFHTVPAEELIEERPDDSRGAGTKQMKYLGGKK